MAMTSATVTFSGARDGEAALTWGQRLMWRAVYLMGPSQSFLNCPWVLPVYGRPGLPAVLDALGALIGRHEALRTTFADTPGGPVQRVARSGELAVALVEAGQERPLAVAERVSGELGQAVFAHGEEWPLHAAIVTREGRPAAVALAFTHLAVDYQALSLLSEDWRRLLRGEQPPPPSWHPVDQAGLEQTAPFQARSARAIQYWRSVLEDVPLEVFDHPPGEPEDPRFIEVGMESVALAFAASALASRLAISTTSVLLAACATMLATVSGRRRAVMQLVHSNRRDQRTRAMVGTVGQDGLFVLDMPDSDFTATCQAANRAALAAYRNAHYDPAAMTAMREEIGRARGREPDLDAFVNDRRDGGGWPSLPAPGPGEDLAALAGKTSTYVNNAWPGVRFKVLFTVGTAPGTGQLSLIVDTAYLPRELARSMLLGIEALLVRAAAADVPVADIPGVCGVSAIAPQP
jgi:hypothetical protein